MDEDDLELLKDNTNSILDCADNLIEILENPDFMDK